MGRKGWWLRQGVRRPACPSLLRQPARTRQQGHIPFVGLDINGCSCQEKARDSDASRAERPPVTGLGSLDEQVTRGGAEEDGRRSLGSCHSHSHLACFRTRCSAELIDRLYMNKYMNYVGTDRAGTAVPQQPFWARRQTQIQGP